MRSSSRNSDHPPAANGGSWTLRNLEQSLRFPSRFPPWAPTRFLPFTSSRSRCKASIDWYGGMGASPALAESLRLPPPPFQAQPDPLRLLPVLLESLIPTFQAFFFGSIPEGDLLQCASKYSRAPPLDPYDASPLMSDFGLFLADAGYSLRYRCEARAIPFLLPPPKHTYSCALKSVFPWFSHATSSRSLDLKKADAPCQADALVFCGIGAVFTRPLSEKHLPEPSFSGALLWRFRLGRCPSWASSFVILFSVSSFPWYSQTNRFLYSP